MPARWPAFSFMKILPLEGITQTQVHIPAGQIVADGIGFVLSLDEVHLGEVELELRLCRRTVCSGRRGARVQDGKDITAEVGETVVIAPSPILVQQVGEVEDVDGE